MATVAPSRQSLTQKGIREDEHPYWIGAFHPDMRSQQLDDDHQAWTKVTGILLTIVSVGVILAAISVMLCMLD